jgi:formylmethanofuran dehydrogenase subunit E
MLSFAEFVAKASAKGPPRPGIYLGIRMSLLAMKLLEVDDPASHRHELIVVVETDRCLPDVIELVVGCRLGNRTLKFRDWGKMAASFVDLTRNRAIRVAARESVEPEAVRIFNDLSRDEALTEAYKAFADDEIIQWRPVIVNFPPEDLPGYRAKRVLCDRCGEGIGLHRDVHRDGITLCRACSGEAYWLPGGTQKSPSG